MAFLSRRAVVPLLLCLMTAAPFTVRAQADGRPPVLLNGPPPILVVREFPKPRHGSAILPAAKAAPFHHIALTSMSGPGRVLFISGYPSFAALEAEGKVGQKNPSAGAAIDDAMVADGDLLAAADVSHWAYRPDLSLNTRDLVGVRYMEYQVIITKPGHGAEVDEWLKMYIQGFKDVPGYNWATYQQAFGTSYYAYLFLARYKSLSEADDAWAFGGSAMKAFNTAHGEAGMKKLAELTRVVVDSGMTNLFRISPEMSRPPEEVIKAEPSFWSPTAASKP